MKKLLIALVVLLGLLAGVRSDAGYQLNNYGSCSHFPDGTGYCYGDFLSVRNTANNNDYAYFSYNTNTQACFFQMSLYGTSGSCFFTAAQASLCPIALAHKGGFRVDFDNGNCTYMFFANGSQYSNF